jgi:hypothetical protein
MSAPVAIWSRFPLVGWSNLTALPCCWQAGEEAVEVCVTVRENVQVLSGPKAGKVLLDRSDLVQEPERIERHHDRAETLLHGVINGI